MVFKEKEKKKEQEKAEGGKMSVGLKGGTKVGATDLRNEVLRNSWKSEGGSQTLSWLEGSQTSFWLE